MTFEEFYKRLPKGVIGAIMRRSDMLWSIRIWEDVLTGAGSPMTKERFSVYFLGAQDESAEALFVRTLPVVEAYLKALQPHQVEIVGGRTG